MKIEWQPIETAPKDGTKIWAWLYDRGICAMRWVTAEERAEADECDNPEMYDPCWVLSCSPDDSYTPRCWLPLDSIPLPVGIIWVQDGNEGRWRDEAPAQTAGERS